MEARSSRWTWAAAKPWGQTSPQRSLHLALWPHADQLSPRAGVPRAHGLAPVATAIVFPMCRKSRKDLCSAPWAAFTRREIISLAPGPPRVPRSFDPPVCSPAQSLPPCYRCDALRGYALGRRTRSPGCAHQPVVDGGSSLFKREVAHPPFVGDPSSSFPAQSCKRRGPQGCYQEVLPVRLTG